MGKNRSSVGNNKRQLSIEKCVALGEVALDNNSEFCIISSMYMGRDPDNDSIVIIKDSYTRRYKEVDISSVTNNQLIQAQKSILRAYALITEGRRP